MDRTLGDEIEACALEELNLWLVTECDGLGFHERQEWLLHWANRRANNVVEFLLGPMKEIKQILENASNVCGYKQACSDVYFVARRALMAAAEDGTRGDDV